MYGIFDNEADHIIAMVYEHATLAAICGASCPACGANMVVSFNNDGSGFTLNCEGDPMHLTKQYDIDNPPPWWRQCYEEPKDTISYWRKWHSYDDNGTLHLKVSGWAAADFTHWSGEMKCPRDHQDYALWQWILHESGCGKDLISDTDLNELRNQYRSAK